MTTKEKWNLFSIWRLKRSNVCFRNFSIFVYFLYSYFFCMTTKGSFRQCSRKGSFCNCSIWQRKNVFVIFLYDNEKKFSYVFYLTRREINIFVCFLYDDSRKYMTSEEKWSILEVKYSLETSCILFRRHVKKHTKTYFISLYSSYRKHTKKYFTSKILHFSSDVMYFLRVFSKRKHTKKIHDTHDTRQKENTRRKYMTHEENTWHTSFLFGRHIENTRHTSCIFFVCFLFYMTTKEKWSMFSYVFSHDA